MAAFKEKGPPRSREEVLKCVQGLLAQATSPYLAKELTERAVLGACRLIVEHGLLLPGSPPLDGVQAEPRLIVNRYDSRCRHCSSKCARGSEVIWLHDFGVFHSTCWDTYAEEQAKVHGREWTKPVQVGGYRRYKEEGDEDDLDQFPRRRRW